MVLGAQDRVKIYKDADKPTIIQLNRKCSNISVEQASKYNDPIHNPSTIKVAHPDNKAAQPDTLG